MPILFMPLTLFMRVVFPDLPEAFANFPALVLSLLGLVMLIWKRNTFKDGISKFAIGYILISLGSVGLSAILASREVNWINPLVLFEHFFYILLHILALYILVKETVRSTEDIKNFFRGSIVLLFLLVVIGGLQAIYLYFGQLESVVSFLGRFEFRWADRANWYAAGSYVQSMNRINGLMPEASEYAAQLGVFSLPIIYSCYRNKLSLFGRRFSLNRVLYLSLLIFSFVLNLIAQSTSGILLVGLSILVIFIDIIRTQSKRIIMIFIVSVGLGLIGVVISFFMIPEFYDFLNFWLLNKESPNRLGSTVAYLRVILSHPFIGVTVANVFALEYVPIETTLNEEFIQHFLQNRGILRLSTIFDVLARYGLVVVLPIFIFVLVQYRKTCEIIRGFYGKNVVAEEDNLLRTFKDSFLLYSIFLLVNSIFIPRIEVRTMYLLMMIFFLATTRRIRVLAQEQVLGSLHMSKSMLTRVERSRIKKKISL